MIEVIKVPRGILLPTARKKTMTPMPESYEKDRNYLLKSYTGSE